MQDIKLGRWIDKNSGREAFCVKVDDDHVWYSLEKNRHVFPVVTSLWISTMEFTGCAAVIAAA